MSALLRVEELRVGFGRRGTGSVVDGVSFAVHAGRAVAIVGESGSGKSVTARTLVGLAGAGSWQTAEALEVLGKPAPLGAGPSSRAWRSIRGRQIGLVLQDALVSLDPLRPIGREIGDAIRLHTPLSAAQRTARVLELLEAVGMPDPAERIGQRSGELSGGQRQRALIAAGLAADPAVLIADEPTTALDTTVQAQILALFETVKARGTGLLFISHDLAVVSRIADEVLVMRAGRVVEQGPAAEVLGDPQHEYTKALLRAVPAGVPRGRRLSEGAGAPGAGAQDAVDAAAAASLEAPLDLMSGGSVLEVRDVRKTFAVRGRERGDVRVAVDGVSLEIARGTTLGLVGESGSGKTTLARMVLGLATPDSGEVLLDGAPWAPGPERLRRARRPLMGAVYQDALSSFDPRLTVGQILADALDVPGVRADPRDRHSPVAEPGSGARTYPSGRDAAGAEPTGANRAARADRVTGLLEDVGLAAETAGMRPIHLSGGQRQRVAIARALAPGPELLICDEPVSALDVSIQAQILDLFDELQRTRGLSYLFISHDLGVIRHMSDRVAVMKDGRIVEHGTTEAVFASPADAYTRTLLAAVLPPPGPARTL
ncbi:dipeptide ABC transporter ATP-binding protein [Herbiconiux solani]|uniref:dipeptide ABC transporter ATP-binding protein n=1 Tax=Herbiconiux solani TaxID=661329 RepID=UPI000825597B|nr:ABC transporter ATP-binding protein [Herbiconiux solani]